jgi:membrane protease subunit HflK
VERNSQKNGLVNLMAAIAVAIAAFVVTVFVNSLAGQVASVFLGLGALIAFAGWFQMRLEENERLEKLEIEELARSKGDSTLFETKDSEVFPARNAREQFERFFVPGFAVLLFLLEAGGAWLLWRWTGKTTSVLDTARAMPALSLFAIFSLLLFLLGRFSVTISRLENYRLLRPGSSFLLAGAFVCAFVALAIAGIEGKFLRADFWVARGLCVLLAVMAAELLLSLLLEIYRPRVKGKIVRPLYDSRVVGLLAQPEGLFTTAAQALDYQFGFKVSETWFYQLIQKNLPMLLLAQLIVLLLSTCVVFVNAGEEAVLEHFGQPVATLKAGAHLKLPWPVDKVYRYRTEEIQTFVVGYTPDALSESAPTIVWTIAHAQEENFLVGNSAPLTVSNQTDSVDGTSASDSISKAPPVSFISVSIPVQFQITNVDDWAYRTGEPTNLLQDVATRAVVRYLAGVDLNSLLSSNRLEAMTVLRDQIQTGANNLNLGAKIIFVGLQDIHPPTKVAAAYEQVISAGQEMIAKTNLASAAAISETLMSRALAIATNQVAEANKTQVVSAALAKAALFTNQIPPFEAAPAIYKERAYLQAFADATRNVRKYVLLVTNTEDVMIFDLKDPIRNDLMGLTVPNDK